MARLVLLVALFGSAAAFSNAPSLGLRTTSRAASPRTAAIRMQDDDKLFSFSPVNLPPGTKDTYWETKAPSSDVLGIGKNVPSSNYAAFSVLTALAGAVSVGSLWPLTSEPNPLFIAGSFLLPYSWALHVAAWIQKNNGK